MKKIISLILVVLLSFSFFGCSKKDHNNDAKIPLDNDSISFVDYNDAVEQFEAAGFTNIETKAVDDLITGWLNKDGEVSEITIDGKKDFSSGSWVSKDAHIVIKYHTFPSTESDEDEDEDDTLSQELTENETTQKMNCDLEKAKRALVVAITNAHADDVLKSDGNTYDKSKFHSYSDLSGFYLIVNDWGEWTAKDENTWHAEDVSLEIAATGLEIDAIADVKYDGKNYKVFNLEGDYGYNMSLSDIENGYSNPEMFLTVSPNLVEKDRSQSELDEKDKSDVLGETYAWSAFELYGKEQYPYGFKCHWIKNLIVSKQDRSTGAWYIKVGVTITNAYGASYETVAEATVEGTDDNPIVKNFNIKN